MAEISVAKVGEHDQGWELEVRVAEGGGSSTHHVTVARSDFERLGTTSGSPEEFVRLCFRFLLEREPKESILSRFDVRQIGHYFPEFETEIVKPRTR